MRKKAKYILASLLMFCVATSVNAEECSYDKQVELNNLAAQVKAVYEESEIDSGATYIPEEEGDPDGPIMLHAFKTKILNVSKDIVVRVEDESGDTKVYGYSDSDNGTIVLDEKIADTVYNYTITVVGAKEDCDGQELRTISLVVPRYNDYSEYAVCKEYPEFEYCKKYTTDLENISMTEFVNKAESYKKSHKSETEKKQEKKNESFIKKNKKTIIIIASVIAIVGVATAAILIIRRRSRLI